MPGFIASPGAWIHSSISERRSLDTTSRFGSQQATQKERERDESAKKAFGISLFYFPFLGLFASLQLQFYFREFSKIFWAVRLSRAKIKCKSDFLMRAREKKKRKAERKLKSRFFDLSTLSLNCAQLMRISSICFLKPNGFLSLQSGICHRG